MRFIIEIPDELAQRSASATESSSSAPAAQTIYAASNALSGGAGPAGSGGQTAIPSQLQHDSVSAGAAQSEWTELNASVAQSAHNDGGAGPTAR